MNGDDIRGCVADNASTDVRLDIAITDRHHRDRCRRGQPIGFVVSAGVVTDIVEVAEYERHCAES